MAAVRFDTLDYARKLEGAGVPRDQAALQAKALGDALAQPAYDDQIERLETRFDRLEAKVDVLEARVHRGFADIETRFAQLDARIDAVKLELGGKIATLQWMFGAMFALNGTALVQLLFRH